MKNKEELLQHYFDGELTPAQEREALHLFAEDPEMRSMLRFEQQLNHAFRAFPRPQDFEVPEGFSSRVMHQIAAREERPARESIFEKLKSWAEELFTPRTIRLRPVYGLATVLVLVATLSFPLYLVERSPQLANSETANRSVQQVSETTDQVWLRFVYIDENAESIAVAGDFSDWDPIPLTKQEINGEQVWTGLVSMARGEHRYMFVKDGETWLTDPLAPVQREDGFGNKNAVIYL